MEEPPRSLLRFRGRLWESMLFEREAGWETDRIERRPRRGDGEYLLELLSADDTVLSTVEPDVDFHRRTTVGPSEMRSAEIVAYVPMHPDARQIVFRRGELVLHREEVAPVAPRIELERVHDIGDGRVEVQWHAEQIGDRPLSFDLLYIVDGRRAFYLARGWHETSYEADLRTHVGSSEARIAVLVSDGTRSAFAVSEPFEVEQKPPRVFIHSPGPGETLPADQPVSLSGHAADSAGARLPGEHLTWQVDEREVGRGTELAMATDLEPGRHEVTLRYMGPAELSGEQRITITVAERTEDQQRFLELGRALDHRTS